MSADVRRTLLVSVAIDVETREAKVARLFVQEYVERPVYTASSECM